MTKNAELFFKLKKFQANINTYWQKLRTKDNFSDVTLACENKQVKAHKVVLSACSSVLENILIHNPHQSPLIYLKGVKYSELVSLLDFVYLGEVTIAKEQLNGFLTVANELRIKGLSDENKTVVDELNIQDIQNIQNIEETPRKRRGTMPALPQLTEENIIFNDIEADSVMLTYENEISKEKHNFGETNKDSVVLSDESEISEKMTESNDHYFDEQNKYLKNEYECNVLESIKSDTKIERTIVMGGKNVDKDFDNTISHQYLEENDKKVKIPRTTQHCDISDSNNKEVQDEESNIDNIISQDYKPESSHNYGGDLNSFSNPSKMCTLCDFATDDISKFDIHRQLIHHDHFFCELCPWKSKNKAMLKTHVHIVHEGFRNQCDQCDYKTGDSTNLKRHRRNVHREGGVSYFCEDCDYSSSDISTLKRHKRTIHESVRYPCPHCDFKSSRKTYLNKHVVSKHEGKWSTCNQCNFKSTFQANLKKHINSKHGKNQNK